MTFSTLLADLQHLLATPRTVDERLQVFSDRMRVSCPDAPELASLVAGLYDPRMAERWLRGLWPSTQLLLVTAAVSLGAPVEARKRLVTLVHQLRHDFPPHGDPDGLRPPFVQMPLGAFHWSMWRDATRGKAGPYVAVAALIHSQVRALEHGMLFEASRFGSRLDQNLYRYLRSARILCRYGPQLYELSVSLRHELIHGAA